MTAPQARPREIRYADLLPDNTDAKFEAVCAQAVADYRRTLGTVDGTRSEQVTRWTAEFVAAAAEDESEVDAA